MLILGINFNHPETSVVLANENQLICGIEEERINRIKNFSGFPVEGIKFILKKYGLTLDDIDVITTNNCKNYNLSEKMKYFLKNLLNFSTSFNVSIEKRKTINEYFQIYFNKDIKKKLKSFPHHLCHAAGSYYTSEFEDCNIVSFDGFGNFSSLEIYQVRNNQFKLLKKNVFPHSLGLFYQAITQFLGFKDYGDEYKVMAMAAYGEDKFKTEMDELLNFDNKKINLNLKYFTHYQKKLFSFEDGFPVFPNLFSKNFFDLFGPERKQNDLLLQKHKDIACSLQRKFETISLQIINESYRLSPNKNLILTGGCAMNSLLNGKVIENTNYEDLFINNASSDSGGAIGAISLALEKKKRLKNFVFNGPSYTNDEILNVINKYKDRLNDNNCKYFFEENENKINSIIVDNLKKSNLVGIFRDSMEFGPRALGNRSLIANPQLLNVREIINKKIKYREDFRPFACSIIRDQVNKYFNTKDDKYLDLMNKVFVVKKEYENLIPGIIHADKTTRIQTVDEISNQRFFKLIKLFYEQTGLPMVLNTSLNSSEPICCSPANAIDFFLKTKIDVIVLENYVLFR